MFVSWDTESFLASKKKACSFLPRTTTHVHYAPLGPIPISAMGPQPPSGGNSSFDPFLSCHSHHINTDRSRSGMQQAQRFVRQQRSSSVPPSNGDQNAAGGQRREPPSATSSSARTTPMQSPSRRLTATIDVDIVPMFQRPSQMMPQQPPQQLLEPGLLNLMTQLAGGADRDPGMVNAIQNVLGQISRVMAGELTGNLVFNDR